MNYTKKKNFTVYESIPIENENSAYNSSEVRSKEYPANSVQLYHPDGNYVSSVFKPVFVSVFRQNS